MSTNHSLRVVQGAYVSKLQASDIDLLSSKRDQWITALRTLFVSRSDKRLYNDDDCGSAAVPTSGKQKAACTFKDKNEVSLSIPYFEDFKVTPDEAFVLAFHESGHLAGVTDHKKLDDIGAILLDVSSQTELKGKLSRASYPLKKCYLSMDTSRLVGAGVGRCDRLQVIDISLVTAI